MSDVIRRRADGSWGQSDVVPTYASDHAETWSGTADKSKEHVSDEYAKYLATQKNLKDAEIKRLETELDMVQTAWQELKEENVRLLQQCLSLYRAVKKANCNLDEIEEKCEANVWFSRLKERTY